jgi:hypothetical protein
MTADLRLDESDDNELIRWPRRRPRFHVGVSKLLAKTSSASS